MVKSSTKRDWDTYWAGKEHAEEVYSNQDRIARNLDVVGIPAGAVVLEIGAGTGRDSLPIAKTGASVYQLDFSFESLRLMKQMSGDSSIFPVGGDTFHLPFRDNTFDVVFHQGLLEHFRKDEADLMIQEQLRVLKSGGLFLVDVPQRYHPYTILKHILITFGTWFAGWERSFSYPELKKIMIHKGLQPMHAYGEWMVPSLVYRVVREIGKKIQIRLPLYPPGIPFLKTIRIKLRKILIRTSFPLFTGISIGIVARKN